MKDLLRSEEDIQRITSKITGRVVGARILKPKTKDKVAGLGLGKNTVVRQWMQQHGMRSMEEFKEAVADGRFHWTEVYGIGKRVYIKMCLQFGIEPRFESISAEEVKIRRAIRLLKEAGYEIIKR